MTNTYDVIVVGCGHAGAEAVLAAARRGNQCAVFAWIFHVQLACLVTPRLAVLQGQIVGEIDAMGGIMGVAADQTYLQIKVLNRSKAQLFKHFEHKMINMSIPNSFKKPLNRFQT